MLHLRFPPLARVRARAATVAVLTLIMVSACFPDDPVDVDTTTITVQVRDAGNSPVAGAEVTWWPAALSESQATVAGTTGTSGEVTFDVMTAWEDVLIRVSPPDGFAVAEPQSNPVELALLQGVTTVTFRVLAE